MTDKTGADSRPFAAPPDDAIPQMTPRQALRRIAEAAAHTSTADGAGIILANTKMPYELRCEAIYSATHIFAEGWSIFPTSFSGNVYQTNCATRIDGATLMHQQQQCIAPGMRDKHVSCCMAAPIRVNGAAVGVIFSMRLGQAADFTDDDVAQLQQFADDASPLVATLRHRDALQRHTHLMQIINTLPVGVLWTDGYGQVIYINEVQTTMLGYALGDLLNQSDTKGYTRWHSPDSTELYRPDVLPIARTIADGKGCEVVLGTGAYAHHNDTATLVKTHPIFSDDGTLTDIIAILIDVSAQYRTQYEAQRQAVNVDTLLDMLADGVILYDRHGTPIRMSKATLALLGWDGEPSQPTYTRAAMAAALQPQDIAGQPCSLDAIILNRALAGEVVRDIEISVRQPNGTRTLTSMSAAPLRDADSGEITGAINLIRNVTHWQQLDQMKDEFISIASHELRTPLTTLLLAASIMQRRLERNDTAAIAHLTHDIIRQAKYINRLIDNMLALTRISGNTFMIYPQSCDFAAVVRQIVHEQAEQSHRTIALKGADCPINGTADAERIGQVLTNLISNALRFSPAIVSVTVTTLVPLHNEIPQITIAVHDHGKGIPAAAIPLLFEWHHQPDNDALAAPDSGNSGLHIGLVISRAIIEQHGGAIQVHSKIGAGTTFVVTLPITQIAYPAPIHDETDYSLSEITAS